MIGLPESVNTLPESVNTLPESVNTLPESVNTLPESVNTLPESVNALWESVNARPAGDPRINPRRPRPLRPSRRLRVQGHQHRRNGPPRRYRPMPGQTLRQERRGRRSPSVSGQHTAAVRCERQTDLRIHYRSCYVKRPSLSRSCDGQTTEIAGG